MLHNIMKRYRKDFHKIPILRKLLKVLEYLAVREILTLEHITSGPPCAGVESFQDSVLSFTKHMDKQVYQIARNFRDKWIPWPIRKRSCIETDADRMDFHRGASNCNRLSPSYSRSSEAKDCIKQPLPGATQDGACSLDSCSDSYSSGFGTNGTRIRKRKSRWDQSGETNMGSGFSHHKEPRVVGINNGFVGSVDHSSQMERKNVSGSRHNFNEDVPPGFSPLNGSIIASDTSSTHASLHQKSSFHLEYPCEAVMGHPQERFISMLPVSFGIPLAVLQQFGTPQQETTESRTVAAGIPFHPFPPLPPYPHDRRGHTLTATDLPATSVVKVEGFCNPLTHHSDQNSLSTSNAYPSHMGSPGFTNQQNFQRTVGTSNCLGQKYFRQQKWNNAKMPPSLWNRLGRGKPGDGKTCVGVGTGVNEPKQPYNWSRYTK